MPSIDALEQRLQDFLLPYRPQREWIEGRGLLLVMAQFFSGVAAGVWAFSLILDYDAGLIISIVTMTVLAGGAHLVFLGRWQRFWRMILRLRSSWISRGLLGIVLFLAGAIPYAVPGVRESAFGSAMLALSVLGIALLLVQKGFVYVVVKAIPFWSISLLPALYIAYALRGGAALLLVAAAIAGDVFDIDLLEAIKLWVVVSTAVLLLLYLALANNAGGAAKRSLQELVAGRLSPAFYAGAIFLGLMIPAVLGAIGATAGLWRGLLAFVGLSSLAGDFFVQYCIVKAGVYLPIVGELPPARSYHGRPRLF
ncbi:MAG: NrfD/PsrC family molybdoenzyme membrane anchor subunit [Dehalococcoidia bacterium]